MSKFKDNEKLDPYYMLGGGCNGISATDLSDLVKGGRSDTTSKELSEQQLPDDASGECDNNSGRRYVNTLGGWSIQYDTSGGVPLDWSVDRGDGDAVDAQPLEKPSQRQVGGNHYKNLVIQPLEYAVKNNLGAAEHLCLKYITRQKGVEDINKAIHSLELLKEWKYELK